MTALTNAIRNWRWPLSNGRAVADPVVWVFLISLLLLAIVDTRQASRSIGFVLEALIDIAPFFLLAIVFAGYAKASGADALIARAFSGNPVMTIVTAALVGALSPFCSCGVIPLIAAMLGAGVPLAPVMAFWIASPVMDPEIFMLTAAGIGFDFAVAKTVAAVGMGLMAGFAVLGLQGGGYLSKPLQRQSGRGACRPAFDAKVKIDVAWRFWHAPHRRRQFGEELRANAWFLGKWLAFAFLLESLMIAYLPAHWIGNLVGGDSPLAIPLATLVGIPSYLNGYAAIPLVSGLMDMGMSPGAAMAFITAGAVSSIPAAIAVFALVRKPVFAVYVGLGLVGSALAGWGYQFYLN